ncbi:MAG: alkaline phosphatase D family protein, partial [Myxococcales bacterium]|nr:alkaline phosphatase D family protein [Myxococcales bacterium]
ADVGNVVAITGDIHAFFASTPWDMRDPSKKIPEFVGGAISSATYGDLLFRQASADPTLSAAGAPALAATLESFLTNSNPNPNPWLAYAETDEHGFVVVDADSSTFNVAFYQASQGLVQSRVTDAAELQSEFETIKFKVDAGSPEIYRDFDGTWRRWDSEAIEYVDA